MDMLLKVLRKRAEVVEIRSFPRLIAFFLRCPFASSSMRILVYTSLLAPFVSALRLLKPSARLFYMVRGDEITYVKQKSRYFRAKVSFVFQKLLVLLGCHVGFVF